MSFIIKEINEEYASSSLKEVGFDTSYVAKASEKYHFKLLKIFALTPQQASILKQTALSVGADCAVHREVITCKVETTDIVLGATMSQIRAIAQKLKSQPFSLGKLANTLVEAIESVKTPLVIRGKSFDWSKTYLMGILNITPDSFSDGGKYLSLDMALDQAEKLAETSDIIDIGGESTRPGSKRVSSVEEIKRVCPVITSIRDNGIDIPISIDTRNAETARQAILAGADIVNDVSGGVWDPGMVDVVAEFQTPFILMHSFGAPDIMQDNPIYEKVVDEVYLDLESKISKAVQKGVSKEKIIIDIGIGFGKTPEHNFELLQRIGEFKSLGCPLLVGVSRKSFMSSVVELDEEQKDAASLAVGACLAKAGVDILRVHNPWLYQKPLMIIDKI
ncbi:MAG: dihydropteroate synthase [Candidatus Gastranaerophilales bacterium]|nr:dihydropteroate synthase [Candidatus Gastranaerophilales bacterium]